MRSMQILAISSGLILGGQALAKGLEDLSQQNPESEVAPGDEDKKPADEGGEAKQAAPMVQSATSKALQDKLSLTTSFGWVKASKGKGEWKGSGMSDLTVGYKFAAVSPTMSLDGTYRYAPVAVSGVEDDVSYRGVWETHFFGARLHYAMGSTTVVGSGEVGYTMVHTKPVDGQEQVKKAEAGGGQVALGGGADFHVIDKNMTAGPRLILGFGSFTTIQVAGAVGFLF